jgi:hypothetical protein
MKAVPYASVASGANARDEITKLLRAETGLANAESDHASSMELVRYHKELAEAVERDAEFWRQDADLQTQKVAAWRAEVERLKKPVEPL